MLFFKKKNHEKVFFQFFIALILLAPQAFFAKRGSNPIKKMTRRVKKTLESSNEKIANKLNNSRVVKKLNKREAIAAKKKSPRRKPLLRKSPSRKPLLRKSLARKSIARKFPLRKNALKNSPTLPVVPKPDPIVLPTPTIHTLEDLHTHVWKEYKEKYSKEMSAFSAIPSIPQCSSNLLEHLQEIHPTWWKNEGKFYMPPTSQEEKIMFDLNKSHVDCDNITRQGDSLRKHLKAYANDQSPEHSQELKEILKILKQQLQDYKKKCLTDQIKYKEYLEGCGVMKLHKTYHGKKSTVNFQDFPYIKTLSTIGELSLALTNVLRPQTVEDNVSKGNQILEDINHPPLKENKIQVNKIIYD